MKKVGSHLSGKGGDVADFTLLKRIFWTIQRMYRVPLGQWVNLLAEYSANPMNVERQTRDGRNQATNNLSDALTGDNISFLQLVRGLKVIKIWRMRITIEVWREHEKDEPPIVVIVDEKLANLNTRNAGKDSNI